MIISTKLVKELRKITSAGILDCKKALEKTNGNIDKAIKWLREKRILKVIKKNDRIALEGLISINVNNDNVVIFEVNSETDFVAKNDQFNKLIKAVGDVLLNNDVKTVKEALKIKITNETLEEYIINIIATIGEKIILRRFTKFNKLNNQQIGLYLHANKKIGSIILFKGSINSKLAKQVAMHIVAMNPKVLSRNDISQDFLTSEKEILTTEVKNDPNNIGKPCNILKKIVEGRLNKQLCEICLLDQQFIINPDIKVGEFIKKNKSNIINFIRYEVGEKD